MGLFDEEIERLKKESEARRQEVQQAQAEAEKLDKRLYKLSKVQEWEEPVPGTVLRFSRTLAGSSAKYTFVVARIGLRWYVTGTDNALRLLGLSNKGNTWLDVLVAIGDNKVKVATTWKDPHAPSPEAEYHYFESPVAQWRVKNGVTEFRERFFHSPPSWTEASVRLSYLQAMAAEHDNSLSEVDSLSPQRGT